MGRAQAEEKTVLAPASLLLLPPSSKLNAGDKKGDEGYELFWGLSAFGSAQQDEGGGDRHSFLWSHSYILIPHFMEVEIDCLMWGDPLIPHSPEPAILVMHHSMKPHPAITATLLDFMCRVSAIGLFFSPCCLSRVKCVSLLTL